MRWPTIKRILLIVGFILLIMGLTLVFWLIFLRPLFSPSASNTNGNTNQVNTNGVLPNINVNTSSNTNGNQPLANSTSSLPTPSDVANGSLTLTSTVIGKNVTSPTLGQDGKSVRYYDPTTGKFFQVNPTNGTLSLLSPTAFADVSNITWSPDSNKAVLEFPDGRKVLYDFTTKKQYSFNSDDKDFSFSPDSAKVAYKFVTADDTKNVLLTSDITGSKTQVVTEIADKDPFIQVAWSPSSEVVGFFRQGTGGSNQEVIMIGQNQENFKSLQTDGRGFQGKWTPDGNKLLYTVYSDASNFNPELHLVQAKGDAIGAGNTDLGISTFIDKCTFDTQGAYAYCAVPDALTPGSGPYPEFSQDVKDTMYSINLQTGAQSKVAEPVTDNYTRFNVQHPFLSSDGSVLYFTDASSGNVHSIRLR